MKQSLKELATPKRLLPIKRLLANQTQDDQVKNLNKRTFRSPQLLLNTRKW
jgi:hypothetical protein